MSSNKPIKLLCVLCLLNHSAPILAAEKNSPPPIEVEADRVDINAEKGTSIYEGNAIMTHGEMRISGSRMEIFTSEEGELSHVIVTGQPARYRDVPPGQSREVRAIAGRMEYYASGPERAIFSNRAKLWQGQDSLSAARIFVNLETQAVEAKGKEDERARAILHPQQREEL